MEGGDDCMKILHEFLNVGFEFSWTMVNVDDGVDWVGELLVCVELKDDVGAVVNIGIWCFW